MPAGACAADVLEGKYWADWPSALPGLKLAVDSYGACCDACTDLLSCLRFTFWPGRPGPCRLFTTPSSVLYPAQGALSFKSAWAVFCFSAQLHAHHLRRPGLPLAAPAEDRQLALCEAACSCHDARRSQSRPAAIASDQLTPSSRQHTPITHARVASPPCAASTSW